MTTKRNEIGSLDQLLGDIKTDGDCAELIKNSGNLDKIPEVFLRNPIDAHLHLREKDLLRIVAILSAKYFSGGVVMPNLENPVELLGQVVKYKKDIMNAIGEEEFIPHMTINFNPNFTREQLEELKPYIIGIKMYPKGQTTNSEGGINCSEFESYSRVLKDMEELGIPLLVHGEIVDGGDKVDETDKERMFATIYQKLAEDYPSLKIIMEHVSTKEVLSLLDEYDNLYATVTLQHLLLIHNHVVSGGTKSHIMCMPIAKEWDDRKSILEKVLSGYPKIMFGSDSAPHTKNKKESENSCAGIFSAPIALQVLVEIFEYFGCLDKLQGFISDNFKKIYGFDDIKEKVIKLVKKDFQVPETYGEGENEIVPFLNGRKLKWSVENDG